MEVGIDEPHVIAPYSLDFRRSALSEKAGK
jgi:hypothetical protein